MKIVHINFVDDSGGAAKAAYRLNEALLKKSISSKLLVMNKMTNNHNVIQLGNKRTLLVNKLNRYLEKRNIDMYAGKQRKIFSLNGFGGKVSEHPLIKSADIIHLHWINNSMISMKDLEKLFSIGKPIVWTMHDMWAITGGCHYSEGCNKYKTTCSECHMLNKNLYIDISKKHFNIKMNLFKKNNFRIVTCSEWLKTCVEESSLLGDKQIDVIPNTLNSEVFKRTNKKFAKESLGISDNKKVILFGAMNSTHDKRKGWKYLKEVLCSFKKTDEMMLLIFGSEDSADLLNIELDYKFLGNIKDEYTLQLAYNASDVLVTPSLEDNLPNTVMESIACGTPVVSFNIGGFPDMIDHKCNGYLAKEKDVDDLEVGIRWVLSRDSNEISEQCVRIFNEKFKSSIVSNHYSKLYESLLN